MKKYIDKISAILVGFGIDFWIHLAVVMFIAMVVARVCFWTGADKILAGCVGAFLAFIVGFIKESYDNKTTGIFSTSDIVADFAGAVFFLLIWA